MENNRYERSFAYLLVRLLTLDIYIHVLSTLVPKSFLRDELQASGPQQPYELLYRIYLPV